MRRPQPPAPPAKSGPGKRANKTFGDAKEIITERTAAGPGSPGKYYKRLEERRGGKMIAAPMKVEAIAMAITLGDQLTELFGVFAWA